MDTLSPVIGRQSPFNEEIFVIVTVLERHEWLCPTETVLCNYIVKLWIH